MLLNYLRIAVRNFQRHLVYSSINVMGLAVGLATSLLIFVWVINELQFDTSYDDHERIYQVMYNSRFTDGHVETGVSTSGPLAEAIQSDIAEVEFVGRFDDPTKRLLRLGTKSLLQNGLWADPGIIKIFSIKVLKGARENLLKDPHSFVITEETAKKFFPNGEAVGKTFRIDEKYDMTVAAVVENPHENSSIQYDFLLPYEVRYKENEWMSRWGNYNDPTFIKIKPHASIDVVNKKLQALVKSKCPDCYHQPFAQQLSERHLYDRYENGEAVGGRIDYVRIFMLTAIFILIIACINYMNLATARSTSRSREVGVRKATGAHRSQLVFQFIGESFLITSVSVVLAVVLVQILLPVFNLFMSRKVAVDFFSPGFLLSLLGLTVVTSMIAGSYPAFFLSGFKPSSVLKGQVQSGMAGVSLRKGLVIFQFALSVILIMASLVVFNQTSFIMSKNLGFNRENILVFEMHDGVSGNQQAFKNEVLKFPGIHGITFAGQNPFDIGGRTTDVKWAGKNAEEIVPFRLVFTDKDFIPTMQIELKEGANFTNNIGDSINYIINETAAKRIGYDQPVGAKLDVWNSPAGKIIGVVKDFHNMNLHVDIEPLIIMCRPDNTWRGFVKLESGMAPQAIKHLEATQKKFDPNYPFDYQFLDKNFEKEYASESTIQKIAVGFTSVALFISGLGLFGLASFMAERRTKEIGVRKVMGATVSQVTVLLSKDFLKLLAVAFAIAIPVAWYGAQQWLITFAYHVNMTIALPVIAAGVLVLIALVSVGYQSVKAAVGNPVESLRSE